MSEELNQLKVDIALIKKDIKSIEKFFNKMDAAVDTMSGIAKDLAIQETIVKATEQKLQFLDKKIEDHTKVDLEGRMTLKEKIEDVRAEMKTDLQYYEEKNKNNSDGRDDDIIEKINELTNKIDNKLTDYDKRIRSLEYMKWYIYGMGVVIIFIATQISSNITTLFTN